MEELTMSFRLYFIIPTVKTAQEIEKELLLSRIDSSRMHFLAKENTDLKGLPECNFLQKSDIVHGMEMGVIAGGIAGALAGVAAMLFLNISSSMAGIVGLIAMFGAVFGAWISGMIGTNIPNTRLKKFKADLDEGHVLLMLDVPRERITEVKDVVKKHHPDTDFSGTEPNIPAFP